MTRGDAELEPLQSVVSAVVTEDGALCRANAGFRRLVEPATPTSEGASVAHCFIQPSFAALAGAPADADGVVHAGLLTIGDYVGRTVTVRGTVTRAGRELRVLAEHDIAELERLNAVVLALNATTAAAHRDLAQAHLELQQLNAALARQTAEAQASLARVKRLEGLLSICMFCKKIRAGDDDWQAVEQYVTEHSDATLSHGMCPDCYAAQRKRFGLGDAKTP